MKHDPSLLDFNLTPELQEMGELLREVCEKEIIPRRAHLDEHEEYPFEIFAKFKEAGLPSIMYEEEYGGAGVGLFGGILFAEIVSE